MKGSGQSSEGGAATGAWWVCGGAESCSPSLPYSRAKERKAWRPISSVSFQMKSPGLRLVVVVGHRNVDAGDRSVAISPVYVEWHSQRFRTKRRCSVSFGCFVLEGAALRKGGALRTYTPWATINLPHVIDFGYQRACNRAQECLR